LKRSLLQGDGRTPRQRHGSPRQNFEIDAQEIVRASLRAISEILAEQMDVELRCFEEVNALVSIRRTALRPCRGLTARQRTDC
jgi:hypothetical protein